MTYQRLAIAVGLLVVGLATILAAPRLGLQLDDDVRAVLIGLLSLSTTYLSGVLTPQPRKS